VLYPRPQLKEGEPTAVHERNWSAYFFMTAALTFFFVINKNVFNVYMYIDTKAVGCMQSRLNGRKV